MEQGDTPHQPRILAHGVRIPLAVNKPVRKVGCVEYGRPFIQAAATLLPPV